MNNRIVLQNFSKNAETYDEYALVQKECADKLLHLIPGYADRNIFEIGCGNRCFY